MEPPPPPASMRVEDLDAFSGSEKMAVMEKSDVIHHVKECVDVLRGSRHLPLNTSALL
jgi:hypothetical protein